MIYEIRGHLRTDNIGIRNAIANILPSPSDPKFHGELGAFYKLYMGPDDDGINVISFTYRYTLVSDMEALLNVLKALTGVINACEDGSFVEPVDCGHNTIPPTSCKLRVGGIRK